MEVFITTAGEKIEYGPIALDELQLAQNAVRAEFEERGEPIEPPIYQVEVLGGEFEEHPYSAKSIEDAPEEDKAKWAVYQEAMTRLEDEMQHRTALILLEAIKVTLPDDDTWVKRRKRLFNEDVPADPEERLLFYVNNVLLKTPADKQGLQEAIFDLSMAGTPQEVKQAYKDLFRREMEQRGRAAIKLIEALEGSGSQVVLQPVVERRLDSPGTGDAAEPVSGARPKGQGRGNGDNRDAK